MLKMEALFMIERRCHLKVKGYKVTTTRKDSVYALLLY